MFYWSVAFARVRPLPVGYQSKSVLNTSINWYNTWCNNLYCVAWEKIYSKLTLIFTISHWCNKINDDLYLLVQVNWLRGFEEICHLVDSCLESNINNIMNSQTSASSRIFIKVRVIGGNQRVFSFLSTSSGKLQILMKVGTMNIYIYRDDITLMPCMLKKIRKVLLLSSPFLEWFLIFLCSCEN